MTRPSLTTLLRRALRGECALAPGSTLVVAVSGGPDSMALLSGLSLLREEHGLDLYAHGVDHGLRPEASEELDLAASFAASVGVPFARTKVHVAPGGNIQERAREARWTALRMAAQGHRAAIATAHHADDRAETLLLRLLRGSGKRGLGVLPARATAPVPRAMDAAEECIVPVLRPLLRVRREDILAHLARHKVPFARDPSNEDPRYLRTRVRNDLIPLLAELDPQIVEHLDALADELVVETATSPSSSAELPWASSLPRATQHAIVRLTKPGGESERVWLPGGLVLSVDPAARKRAT
jgi:tRNA(Ile)-lysidine synthase